MATHSWFIVLLLLALMVGSSLGGLPITPYRVIDFGDRRAVQGTIEHSAHVFATVASPGMNSSVSQFFSPDFNDGYYLECKSTIFPNPILPRGVPAGLDQTKWALNCTTDGLVSPAAQVCYSDTPEADGCVATLALTGDTLEIGIKVSQFESEPRLNHSFATFVMDVLAGFEGGVMDVTRGQTATAFELRRFRVSNSTGYGMGMRLIADNETEAYYSTEQPLVPIFVERIESWSEDDRLYMCFDHFDALATPTILERVQTVEIFSGMDVNGIFNYRVSMGAVYTTGSPLTMQTPTFTQGWIDQNSNSVIDAGDVITLSLEITSLCAIKTGSIDVKIDPVYFSTQGLSIVSWSTPTGVVLSDPSSLWVTNITVPYSAADGLAKVTLEFGVLMSVDPAFLINGTTLPMIVEVSTNFQGTFTLGSELPLPVCYLAYDELERDRAQLINDLDKCRASINAATKEGKRLVKQIKRALQKLSELQNDLNEEGCAGGSLNRRLIDNLTPPESVIALSECRKQVSKVQGKVSQLRAELAECTNPEYATLNDKALMTEEQRTRVLADYLDGLNKRIRAAEVDLKACRAR